MRRFARVVRKVFQIVLFVVLLSLFLSPFDTIPGTLPSRIAVLPALGKGDDRDRKEIRTTIANHLSVKRYEDMELTDVDFKLLELEKSTGRKWNDLPLEKVGEALGVDGLVLVDVLGINKVYAVAYAHVSIEVRLKLFDVKTRRVVWEKVSSATNRGGGVPVTPLGLISSAISSALVLRESSKIAVMDELARELLKDMPEPEGGRRKVLLTAVHSNAPQRLFGRGDEIVLSIEGEKNKVASFDIGDFKKGILMHEMEPGKYVGKYVVTTRDGEVRDQTIVAYLSDPDSKAETKWIVPWPITIDTVPPEGVTGLRARAVSDGIRLVWDAIADEDVKGYVVERSTLERPVFERIGETSIPEYMDTTVEPDMAYYYRVRAVDLAGNRSRAVEVKVSSVKAGPTELKGDISEDTVLYSIGSPYIISQPIRVLKGVTLTLEQGTTVEFMEKGSIQSYGSIIARGKEDVPVVIKGRGWSIRMEDAGRSVLEWARLEGAETALWVTSSKLVLRNVSIVDSERCITLRNGSTLEIKDSSILNCKHGIEASESRVVVDGVVFRGNGTALFVDNLSSLEFIKGTMEDNTFHIKTLVPVRIKAISFGEKDIYSVVTRMQGEISVDDVNGSGRTLEEMKDEWVARMTQSLSRDLAEERFDSAIDITKRILSIKRDRGEKFIPLLAYAYTRKGRKDRALSLLAGRDDLYSVLLRLYITGERTVPPGLEDEVEGVDVYLVDVGLPGGAFSLESAIYKKALKKAMKDAFLSLVEDPARSHWEAFEEKVLPSSKKYYLGHYVLSQRETDGYFVFNVVTFLDTGRLKRSLEVMGLVREKKGHRLKVALITKKGTDLTRKALLKDLQDMGFVAEDMGVGELDPALMKKTRGAVVVQIKEEPKVSGNVLGSKFKSIEGTLEFSILNGNNGIVLSRLTRSYTLVHLNEGVGKELAIKKAYEKALTTLAETIVDIETRMGEEIASGALPPIEISFIDTREVFSNIYKLYAEEPVGTLSIKNNTEMAIKKIKVSLSVKGYMDYPTEIVVDEVGPGERKLVPVRAVFNNRILELTENTLLQSEIKVTYMDEGRENVVRLRQPIQVYEKHALVWDDKGKVATFITARDPVVAGFATKAVREYNYPYLNQAMVKARAVFGAMGVLGIKYVPDPTPYSMVSSVTTIVDNVQYPRETLARKAGDCDDLVSLFGAALESLGIRVIPIDAPGHLFIMFDTSVPESLEDEFGFPRESYVIHDGTIWIPFETTLVGSSFTLAWEKGAKNLRQWKDRVKFIDPRKVWERYKPATLPPDEFKIDIGMDDIERKFGGELDELKKRRVNFLAKRLGRLGDYGLRQALILYGENGMVDEAFEIAERLMERYPYDPSLLNNMGNLYYIRGDLESALESYQRALQYSPSDAGILVNITRIYLKRGERLKAKETFRRAISLDPGIKERYLKLSVQVEG